MALLLNRAKMTTATTGTGTVTLGSAVAPFQTFSAAGAVNALIYSYLIEDGSAWEVGTGTYTSSGTTVSRTLTQSSTGSLLNLSGGATISIIFRAEDNIGRLINTQTITATGAGTYTPTAGTNYIIIELQGAGGGGGGSPQPGSGKVSNASNGGGGAWGRVKLTTSFSGASYSVGAKGAGGSAGANAGANGGSTTFTNTAGSPVTWTTGGGTGGFAGGTGATPPTFSFGVGGGAVSGGTFDISRPGGDSLPGIGPASGQAVSQLGGNSMYSPGSACNNLFTANGQGAGLNAGGFGGGGGAAVVTGTGTASAGGNGSDGIIIIYEYS